VWEGARRLLRRPGMCGSSRFRAMPTDAQRVNSLGTRLVRLRLRQDGAPGNRNDNMRIISAEGGH